MKGNASLLIYILAVLFIVQTASARVDITYTFLNAQEAVMQAFDCADNACSNVNQFSGSFPNGPKTTNGNIAASFPDKLSTQYGYLIFYFSKGFMPKVERAYWNSAGSPKIATGQVFVSMNKKKLCSAKINSVSADNLGNSKVSVLSSISSPFEFTDMQSPTIIKSASGQITPVYTLIPSNFKDEFYRADIRVKLSATSPKGTIIELMQDFTGKNGLLAGTAQNANFEFLAPFPGDYQIAVKTTVLDDQCSTKTENSSTTTLTVPTPIPPPITPPTPPPIASPTPTPPPITPPTPPPIASPTPTPTPISTPTPTPPPTSAPVKYTLSFQLMDSSTGTPLTGALVNVQGTAVLTDALGMASLNFDEGNYTFAISFNGYISKQGTVQLNADKNLVLTLDKIQTSTPTPTPTQSPTPETTQNANEDVKRDKRTIFVESIRLPLYIPSNSRELELFATIQNDDTKKMDDVKITAYLFDANARGAEGPFDLSGGEKVTKRIIVPLPSGIEEGEYALRLTVNQDGNKRIIHRIITVYDE